MTKVFEDARLELATFFREILSGAMIGACFGAISVAGTMAQVSGLPMTSELVFVAVSWCCACIIGGVSVIGFAAARFVYVGLFRKSNARRMWRGAASLAICLWIVLIPSEEASDAYWEHVLTLFVVIIAFGICVWIADRYRLVKAPVFWSGINLLLLCGLLLKVTISGPLKHGIQPAGALLVFIALAVSTVPFLCCSLRMFRRYVPAGVALVMLFLGFVWFLFPYRNPLAGTGASKRTNILLITVDTLRADHLGCYGNGTVRTPFIDQIARQGVLFENTISPTPFTNPSHTSILTGLYPGNHGVVLNNPIDLESGVLTLPRILSQNGYKTAAFISGFTLKRDVCRLMEEFELYDDDFSTHWFIPEACTTRGFSSLLLNLPQSAHLLSRVSKYERRADNVTNAARLWLRSNSGAPFFLWLHLFDPHSPYTPPAPYNKMYDAKYTGKANGDFHVFPLRERLEMIQSPKDLNHIKALYAGEVSYVDEQIGGLLAELDALHLSESTLLIFTSDHGESLTEHNYYFDHGVCLYDEDLRVPLILRFPDGRDAGTRHTNMTQLVDIFPSVLSYLGIPSPGKSDGRSLMNQLTASADLSGSHIAVSVIFEGRIQGGKSLLSIRTPEWKYIRTSPWFADRVVIPGHEEFYDLAADPEETRNLIDARPDMLKQCQSVAAQYWNAWFLTPRDATGRHRLSTPALEKLRSLGYVR
ncbi:MAG: sulfatase-like hydrolase/transferase [Acidobacteriia bacterium]|nr:sulfatase-like hydrolase/transferase [Terriglobia bacterium]